MFDGPRVDRGYDPMRKQGAILLGNGGDNSNGSDGTIYEGAMTAAGTFPTQETLQKVQANVVAAKYDVQRLSLTPASAIDTPPGLQTFSPGSSQDTTVTFRNITAAPATGVKLSISVPAGWTLRWSPAVHAGSVKGIVRLIQVAPGATRERDLQGHLGAGGLQRRSGRQRLLDGQTAGRNPRQRSKRCGTSARSRSTSSRLTRRIRSSSFTTPATVTLTSPTGP